MLVNPYGRSYKYSENLYSSSVLENKPDIRLKPSSLISYGQYSTKSTLWDSSSPKNFSPYHSWARQPTKSGCQHCSKKHNHQNPFLRSNLLQRDWIEEATYSKYTDDEIKRENRNYRQSYKRSSYLSEYTVPNYSSQPGKNDYSSISYENKNFEAVKQMDRFIPGVIDQSFKKEAFKGCSERQEDRESVKEKKVGKKLRLGDYRESEDSFESRKNIINRQIYQSLSGPDSPRFLQKQSPEQPSVPSCIEYNHRKFHLVDILTHD